MERDKSIVGRAVPDERILRPRRPTRSLDEFIAFLAQLEAVFGSPPRRREPATGDDFRL